MRALAENEIHLWWLPWQLGDDRRDLRAVLATYLGVDAETITFASGTHGKPRLDGLPNRLRFNWSHTADIAVVAVTLDIELGVDIEHEQRHTRALGIARRWFAASELALLEPMNEAERLRAFAAIWTVKEAILKAMGYGLSFGLGQVVVDLTADGTPKLQTVGSEVGMTANWKLAHPEAPIPGIVSALAWRGPARRVRSFDRIHTPLDRASDAS